MSLKVTTLWKEFKDADPLKVFYCKDESGASSGGIKCMSYALEPLDVLMEQMADPDTRFFHEMICPDVPCRLYIDLDGNDVEADQSVLERLVHGAQERVTAMYREVFHADVAQEPLVLSATRPGRLSLHLVWDLWFEHVGHVRAFTAKAFAEPLMDKVVVDMQIYPQRRPRPFRMPFCGKRVHGKCMYPLVPFTGAPFSPWLFCLGTVTLHAGCSTTVPLPPMGDLHAIPGIDSRVATPAPSRGGDTSIQQMVYEALSARFQCGPATCIEVRENGTFMFRVDTCCPWRGDFHKSNGQMVFSDELGFIFMQCHDQECSKRRLKLPFTVFSLLSSGQPMTIDWSSKRIKS